MPLDSNTPPSETDVAKNLGIAVAIVQKYRPDWSRFLEVLFGNKALPAAYEAIGQEPSLKQLFVDVHSIATSLASIATSQSVIASRYQAPGTQPPPGT